MASTGSVVEEGLDSPPRPDRPSSAWLTAVVAFALGLGIGVLAVGPVPTVAPTATVVASPEDLEPVTTTTLPEDGGISTRVPSFPDALVAVARTTSSSLDHVLWPHSGPLNTRPMAGAESARFDASGLFLALSSRLPASDLLVLSMGRFNQVRPVATGVNGFAWHDSEPALLSYTTEVDGMWRLHVVKANFSSDVIVEAPAPGGRVVAWGDWGWAIQSSPSQVRLLNPSGEFKDEEAGLAYDSRADGWLFIVGDRPKLVSAGGGVLALDTDLNVGRLAAAEFSPDGGRIALAGERGVNVLDLESLVVDELGGGLTTEVTWSTDSRFVIAPAGSGVVIYDVHTASSYQVLRGRSILAVSVVGGNRT
jgi:hypothetical protein